ncbi:MAG: glucose-6-phosphate isomerase [Clostridiales Family XIII bacterium]|jgi:glucose-6-phosphate isomerase|nr:glucose-6-phosphate isomerase [Clostridiales Family XIII bacterium]
MTKSYSANKALALDFLGCPAAPAASVDRIEKIHEGLMSGNEAFTGWVGLPQRGGDKETERILTAAARIRDGCDVFAVIGIGGSYLGARAAVEMTEDCVGANCAGTPEIMFAGQNISGSYHAKTVDRLAGRNFKLCVISKSGTTTEPNIAFAILKELLFDRYGKDEAVKRIFAITDPKGGALRAEADAEGYESFVIPPDVGGRYSVLSPVGLLPMAVAGIDIKEVLAGAQRAAEDDMRGLAAVLAATRKALLDGGKTVEVFEYYEPAMFMFSEWLKQLYGESEGKNGTGLFPAALSFSTDLHSMGQFLQEGNPIFFETVLDVLRPPRDLTAPASADPLFAGKSMNEVNRAATEGVIAAHRAAGIPIVRVSIPDMSPYSFGMLVYFFELTCAYTGRLMGVDPFNQPGVEQYKKEMKRLLTIN